MKLLLNARLLVGSLLVLFGASLVGNLVIDRAIADDESQSNKSPMLGIPIPTGQMITPTAASGALFQDLNPGYRMAPDIRAGRASNVSTSPDGKLLAILTSGYNVHYGRDGKPIPALSTETLFIFDITRTDPKQIQALPIENTFQGLAWSPASDRIFASGGKDDVVLEFARAGTEFTPTRKFKLGHEAGVGFRLTSNATKDAPYWLDTKAEVAGLAVSPDGNQLLVANLQNDSVSLIGLASGHVVAEQDLRPGVIDAKHRGQSGGSFPRSVVWISANRAYVASERDREIISLSISGTKLRVGPRIPVHGQPIALLANRNGSRMYAALDNTDRVAVLDTAQNTVIEEFSVIAPESLYQNEKRLSGVNPNALALTPDERQLLVSNGGANAIAVVRLSNQARDRVAAHRDRDEAPDAPPSAVIALVPTGWYPTGVTTSKNGGVWYVANSKSPTGPNVSWCHDLDPIRRTCVDEFGAPSKVGSPPILFAENGYTVLSIDNQMTLQNEKAGLLSFPTPGALELARLTKQVARNNRLDQPSRTAADEQLFAFLRNRIKHVIYIVKENRTYDQVLGDLPLGNGDPRLTIFPEPISPNHHAIARNFVTLDNLLVSGEGSWTGWVWDTAARTNDFVERFDAMNLASRGSSVDGRGLNRGLNMSFATNMERKARFPLSVIDPDVLPGTHEVAAMDGPNADEGKGYIWDAVLKRGLTVRNYGFYGDYLPGLAGGMAPLERDPFSKGIQVFYPANGALAPVSDLYFHIFDLAFPDFWRCREWRREFDGYVKSNNLPNLSLIGLGNDHLGDFQRAIDGVNTPETQMADNDYALGLIVEAVANSPFAKDTLVVAIEDDTFDGPDHVDAFRTVALVAGPYVRQNAVVSTRYTTVSVVKTIEEVLGVGPIGLNDALAAPMSEIFDPNVRTWSYNALVPDVLRSTQLPLPPADHASNVIPRHSAAYWTKAMARQDFSSLDRADPVTFNRALWRGLKGGVPYPVQPRDAGLRKHRTKFVAPKPADERVIKCSIITTCRKLSPYSN